LSRQYWRLVKVRAAFHSTVPIVTVKCLTQLAIF
jgi:hypothetical protein